MLLIHYFMSVMCDIDDVDRQLRKVTNVHAIHMLYILALCARMYVVTLTEYFSRWVKWAAVCYIESGGFLRNNGQRQTFLTLVGAHWSFHQCIDFDTIIISFSVSFTFQGTITVKSILAMYVCVGALLRIFSFFFFDICLFYPFSFYLAPLFFSQYVSSGVL